ncbi:MAG: tetratricopeptide repeat protein [Bacteroidales bacterium]|nr:tetratricopeptide repeat protein [Bacteroidales bacterium]
MDKDRFKDFDEEERQLVLDFENTILRGGQRFFDVDELEVIMDYYFEVNDIAPLERAVEYAEQLYPDSTVVKLRRAHLLIAKEQFDDALRIIKTLRRQEPDNTDVAYSLGVAYGAVGEHEKAIELFMEAAADGWLLGRVYANIAEEYFHMDNYEEAIRYYQLSLDTDSYDSATIYNYVDTAIRAHAVDEAIAYLKSFVEEHPYSSEGWHCLGNLYRELSFFERAMDAYEYAIAIDKTNFGAYTDLSTTHEFMGQSAEAVSALLRARDYAPSRSVLYRMVANIYMNAENHDLALIYYRKSVEENPSDPNALAALALAYVLTGESGAAMPLIRSALRQAPDSAEVLFSAAVIYDSIDNFEAASDYFERTMMSDDCTELMCQRYTQFLYKHKVYDILIQFAEESLELYPQSPFYCTYLAAAYFYTNRYNRASQVLPYVSAEFLSELCPEIVQHPRLGPLVPRQLPENDISFSDN